MVFSTQGGGGKDGRGKCGGKENCKGLGKRGNGGTADPQGKQLQDNISRLEEENRRLRSSGSSAAVSLLQGDKDSEANIKEWETTLESAQHMLQDDPEHENLLAHTAQKTTKVTRLNTLIV